MIELNKIYHEDCLEGMKAIDDKSIDMILCDLPYGITACKWDSVIPLEMLWENYARIIKDNGAIVLFGVQPFTSKLITSNLKLFRYEWVWHKPKAMGFLQARLRPLRAHENIIVFSKYASLYNAQGLKPANNHTGRKNKAANGVYLKINNPDYMSKESNFPRSVITFSSDKIKLHPTQKPVALFEYLIKTYTNEGETVLDNCMGSGTTAIACINTNRNYIGFETESKYCEIANKRIQDAMQLKAA